MGQWGFGCLGVVNRCWRIGEIFATRKHSATLRLPIPGNIRNRGGKISREDFRFFRQDRKGGVCPARVIKARMGFSPHGVAARKG